MGHRIARWLFQSLLRLVLSESGHRRRPGTATRDEPPPVTVYLDSPTARRPWERPLRGDDQLLVRPYLAAHTVGIKPFALHAVEVTA